MGESPKQQSGPGWSRAISSNGAMVRFIVLLLSAILGVHLLVALVSDRLLKNNLSIALTPEGSLKISNLAGTQLIKLLAASSGWTPTGFHVGAADSVCAKATGSVHLGVHHLVDAGKNDAEPKTSWVGPKGREWKSISPAPDKRRQLLLDPNSQIGALIGSLGTSTRPGPPLHIGEKADLQNNSEHPRQLWLVVNDVWLDFDKPDLSKEAYLGVADDADVEKVAAWDEIQRTRYSRLFFDDNIGYYLVEITGGSCSL